MTGFSDITPAELREMLRSHALVIGPGEVLVVMLGDGFTPVQIREIHDALNAVLYEHGITAVAVPGNAVSVATVPAVEGIAGPVSASAMYASLALGFNTLLDMGETLSIEETMARVQDGTLFGWLGERYHAGIGLALFGPEDLAACLARFRHLSGGGSAAEVYGVESNGLSLLLAWCVSALRDVGSQPGPAPLPRTG